MSRGRPLVAAVPRYAENRETNWWLRAVWNNPDTRLGGATSAADGMCW
jgi:hypothetical protein